LRKRIDEAKNFIDKKRIFNSIKNLTIVSVSNWLSVKVKDSFLKNFPCEVIQNGIDLNLFYPKKSRAIIDGLYGVKVKFVILRRMQRQYVGSRATHKQAAYKEYYVDYQ
jgi:hypothetical protein